MLGQALPPIHSPMIFPCVSIKTRLLQFARYLWVPEIMTIKHKLRSIGMFIMLLVRLWAIFATDRVLSRRVNSRMWCLLVVVDMFVKGVAISAAKPEFLNAMSMMWQYVAPYTIFYAWSGAMIPTLGLPFRMQVSEIRTTHLHLMHRDTRCVSRRR